MAERLEHPDEPDRDPPLIPPGDAVRGDDLAALRSIIVGPEREQLDSLQERVDDLELRARDVGEVLPQALQRHSHDPNLGKALAPAMERALTTSVQRNPKPLADALFPIMGPAIRKAVAASLASMIESLNKTLEHAFSRQAISWRLEAMRTGKPFAEIVLLKTLLFRAEQVLLIDRKTGLLLQHAHTGTAGTPDADMVSGMLTAIRDFAQDSFRLSGEDSLESFRVGELAVWIEAGPHALIAAVVRGSAPREFHRVLQDTLEQIHLEFGEALESFEGDASTLDRAMPILEQCLRTEYRNEENKARSRSLKLIGAAALVLLLVWAGFTYRARSREGRYVAALRAEPGITVVSTSHDGGRFVVTGLRDPKSRDPLTLVAGTGLAPDDVEGRWSPYYSLDESLVLSRASVALAPPDGTVLSLNGSVLTASGTPPLEWVKEARRLAPLIAGVTSFDAVAALGPSITAVISRLEGRAVLFIKGAPAIANGQDAVLTQVVEDVKSLDAMAEAIGQRFRLEIAGHADADGPPESNEPLSRARAAFLQAAIGKSALARIETTVSGLGSREPAVLSQNEEDKQRNRRVTIRVARLGG